jgi:ABC-type oligopeptide transport system substrate-binding subunit
MRKVVLALSAVLVLAAFTFAGCKSSEKSTTATKKAPATTTAPATK